MRFGLGSLVQISELNSAIAFLSPKNAIALFSWLKNAIALFSSEICTKLPSPHLIPEPWYDHRCMGRVHPWAFQPHRGARKFQSEHHFGDQRSELFVPNFTDKLAWVFSEGIVFYGSAAIDTAKRCAAGYAVPTIFIDESLVLIALVGTSEEGLGELLWHFLKPFIWDLRLSFLLASFSLGWCYYQSAALGGHNPGDFEGRLWGEAVWVQASFSLQKRSLVVPLDRLMPQYNSTWTRAFGRCWRVCWRLKVKSLWLRGHFWF